MPPLLARRIAAVFGFLGVALGAFGAHGLKNVFAQNGNGWLWEKAVFYHLIHAVVLLILARTARNQVAKLPFACFAAGITIFSGSLYLLALTNAHWLGRITPIGGAAFLVGWGCLVCPKDD